MSENGNNNEGKKYKKEKWEIEDYAYTMTGVIVVFLLVGPDLLLSFFDINILGGSFGDLSQEFTEGLVYNYGYDYNQWSLSELRSLSPLLFLLTTTIVFTKDAINARKSGGYTGSLFRHTFESLFEDAIYMAITTIMVYTAVLSGEMYTSWLAGPITWIVFVFIFPIVKKGSRDKSETKMPWFLLSIFIIGIIVEIITGAWLAFPMSWLIICAIKFTEMIRNGIKTIDEVFYSLYYAITVILMSIGMIFDFWITSWLAFPIAIFICWILSKTKRFKKVEDSRTDLV